MRARLPLRAWWMAGLGVLALLAAGCVLDGLDARDAQGATAPRLLVSGGQTGFLSDPNANDWSPQMVTVAGGARTNQYLYFLSDRHSDAAVVRHSIMRAQFVRDGVYSNLEAVLTVSNTPLRAIAVFRKSDWVLTNFSPSIYMLYESGEVDLRSTGNYIPFVSRIFGLSNVRWISTWYSASHATFMGEHLFILAPVAGPGLTARDTILGPSTATSLTNIAWMPVAWMIAKAGFDPEQIRSIAPIELRYAGGKVFGLVVQVGGRLAYAVNLNSWVQPGAEAYTNWGGLSQNNAKAANPITNAASPYFNADRIVRTDSFLHIPGAIDRDPSWDPGTGLYFSSDRDGGKFNLYFVPKNVISIPDTVR